MGAAKKTSKDSCWKKSKMEKLPSNAKFYARRSGL